MCYNSERGKRGREKATKLCQLCWNYSNTYLPHGQFIYVYVYKYMLLIHTLSILFMRILAIIQAGVQWIK